MASISLSKRNLEGLARLCTLGPDQLRLVSSELSKAKDIFLNLEDLSSFIAKFLEKESAVILATNALSIRRLIDKYQIPAEKALEAVEEELIEKKWDPNQLREWRDIRPILQAIATADIVEIVTKASKLYYSRVYHFHDFSVVTDMRPVFDEKRHEVVGGIVENKIYMTISDGREEERTFEISISLDELKRFQILAERAVKKTDVLSEHLKKQKLQVRVYDAEH